MNQKEIAAKYGKEIAKRITSRKDGGDDYASYAVFIDNRMFANGLVHGEVAYCKELAAQELAGQDTITVGNRRLLVL